RLLMCLQTRDAKNTVNVTIEPAPSNFGGVLHLHSAGGGISRICIFLFSDIFPFLVQFQEDVFRHEDFTSHFKRIWNVCSVQGQGNAADSLYVITHIIAAHTITASDPFRKLPIFVQKTNRNTIELKLAEILVWLSFET